MKLRWTLLLILACVFVTPASAKKYGRQVRYAGIHPVAKAEGGGICHIEFPHVHIYGANKLEYRVVADNNVFVGDPVAYGWDGPKYAYKGAHPIQVNVLAGTPEPYVHYCYLTGPHYHYFEPPDDQDYKVVGDAYFYVASTPSTRRSSTRAPSSRSIRRAHGSCCSRASSSKHRSWSRRRRAGRSSVASASQPASRSTSRCRRFRSAFKSVAPG